MALFRPVPGCVVLYPSDAVSTERAVELVANYDGMAYLRITRGGTPVVYENGEEFKIGQSKVVKKSNEDVLTLVTGGVTLPEALKAAEMSGVNVRVVDIFSVKPVDAETLKQCAEETKGNFLVV